MIFPTGWYAERRTRRIGQLTGDLLVGVWILVWWFVGRATRRTVQAVATPAQRSGDAARQLQSQLHDAAEQTARVPGLGAELRRPFDGAVGSLQDVINAADQQVASIERAALVLGWLAFSIPVLLLLVIWLPARIRFSLRARAAQRFIDAAADLDLFALRAMVAQPMHVIARISDDPVTAWRRGDRAVINALAAVELRRCGLLPPTETQASPS
jgi:hypothetical protein